MPSVDEMEKAAEKVWQESGKVRRRWLTAGVAIAAFIVGWCILKVMFKH